MKRSTSIIAIIMVFLLNLVLGGCTEDKIEAPASTPTPALATVVPKKEMTVQEAKRILQNSRAEDYARIFVKSESKLLGCNDIRSFNVSSIDLTRTTDATFYFTLHGSFYGVDKYGSSLGRFIFDYDVSVDRNSGEMNPAWEAKVKKS